jgi:hypothetical protein
VTQLLDLGKKMEGYSRENSLMKLSAIFFLVTSIFCGCAGRAITYSLEDSEIQKPPRPIPMRLMVATFKDSRSEEEKTGRAWGKEVFASQDRSFQNVPEGITKAVIAHLQKTELFQETHPAKFSSAEVTSERLESCRSEADVLLVGSVDHFYGVIHRSAFMTGGAVGAAAAGGLVGGLIALGIESGMSKDMEGHAALAGLELLSTKDGSSLWKGQAEAYFKRNERGLPEGTELALEALKEAVTKLVDQLRDFAAGLEPALKQPAEITRSTIIETRPVPMPPQGE